MQDSSIQSTQTAVWSCSRAFCKKHEAGAELHLSCVLQWRRTCSMGLLIAEDGLGMPRRVAPGLCKLGSHIAAHPGQLVAVHRVNLRQASSAFQPGANGGMSVLMPGA